MGNACQIWSNVACTKLKLWMVFDNLSWAQSNKYINLTNALFNHIEQVLLCRIFNYSLPRMLEAFSMYFSSQLPFLDTIWQSEWYLTNGSEHNQIKIYLTILYEIFSHIQQIILCGIFNFCIPRMLEAFRRVSELQLPFLDATKGQTWYCTTNGSGRRHYKIDIMV